MSADARLTVAAACAFIVILTLRWVAIGGTGDWGWSYEVAARLLHGQTYGREFVITVGPLSYYLLAGMMVLFGDSLLTVSVFLHLCWLAALACGIWAARRIGAGIAETAAAAMLAASLSFPGDSMGHPYNYLATALAGSGLMLLLGARGHPQTAAGAGALLALAFFSKQNVGLVAALIAPAAITAAALIERSAVPARILMAYAAGLAGVLAAGFAAMASVAEMDDILRLLFADASAAKGGLVKNLLRAIPRFSLGGSLELSFAWRAAIEVPLTLAAWTLIAGALWRAARRSPDRAISHPPGKTGRAGLLAVAALSILAIASALPLQGIATALAQWTAPIKAIPPGRALVQAAYIATTLALFGALLPLLRRFGGRETIALVLGVLAITAAHNISGVDYFRYSAPLAVPVAAVLLIRQSGLRPRVLVHGAAVAAVLVHLFPFYAQSFTPLRLLPPQTPFAGMAMPAVGADVIALRMAALSPRISGQRTLWITPGGPHSAYGGLPVPNVPSLFQDTHAPRHERRFFENWQADPPAWIVTAPIVPPAGSTVFGGGAFDGWLRAHYRRIVFGVEYVPGVMPDLWQWRGNGSARAVQP